MAKRSGARRVSGNTTIQAPRGGGGKKPKKAGNTVVNGFKPGSTTAIEMGRQVTR